MPTISIQFNYLRKYKNIHLFIFFCFIFYGRFFCQVTTIDSLKLEVKKAKHDTSIINALIALEQNLPINKTDSSVLLLFKAKQLALKNCVVLSAQKKATPSLLDTYLKKYAHILTALGVNSVFKNKKEQALSYYTEAEKLYIRLKDNAGLANLYQKIGIYFMNNSTNFEEALVYFNKSLVLSEKIGDEQKTNFALSSIASIYYDMGRIRESLALYEKYLRYTERIKDKKETAGIILTMGNIYSLQNQKTEALNNYWISLIIYKKVGDTLGMSKCLNNIGTEYFDNLDYNKALYYFLQSAKLKQTLKNGEEDLSISYRNIGELYSKKGDYICADDYLNRSLKLAKQINNKNALSGAFSGLALNFLNQNKLRSALDCANKYLVLAKEMKNKVEVMYALDILKQVYQKQANYKQALNTQEIYIAMRDSIINEDTKKASYKTKLKYDFEKKALADSMKLINEKKLATSKLVETTAKLKQEKTQRLALIGGLILTLIFSIISYKRFKKSQMQKQIIEDQKKLVDVNQKKTMDSINYAKKIQHSILPSKELISTYFPHHFILFKPKDVVSGDFYWFHHQNNHSFFAAIDCTGHGVPGAFMTMIAHSILVEVVVERKLISPDKILNNLHSLIIKNLQQQKGDQYSQDGMDISVAVIDHKSNLLHFSGARNNGFILDNKQIKVLKATQKSIGGLSLLGEFEPERSFKLETTPLIKDSLLILSTDGIFDQLNQSDEKFGTARFKEMLLELNSANPDESLKIMEFKYNTWKTNTTQLDDVLVFGIKI